MVDKLSTSVSLTAENREYLDREVNNRSAFINDLIEAHRQGKSDIEETIARYRREQLKSELRTVDSRKEEIEHELELINQQISEEKERQQEVVANAREALTETPKTPDNPAVETWAEKANLTPEELLDRISNQ